MELVLTILSISAFLASLTCLASYVALYFYVKSVKTELHNQVKKDFLEAREELLGVENKIEQLLGKQISDAMTHLREVAQNDSAELIEAMMNKQGDTSIDSLGIGSFRNVGK